MSTFEELEQHYPQIIQRMGDRFNAHQFIRELSRQHQGLYIRALAEYADRDAPFMIVHGRLASALHKFDTLITNEGEEPSKDIFGQPNSASVWRKR